MLLRAGSGDLLVHLLSSLCGGGTRAITEQTHSKKDVMCVW